jgi:hypothetical protein
MSEKISTSKAKSAPAKSAAAVRKPATAKAAPVKRASAKSAVAAKLVKKAPVKKAKKAKKVGTKVEAKVKVIRDSFTMPQNDYAKIGELKQVCQKAGLQVKKSELLRAGLHALGQLSVAQLKQTITQMEQIKTGRPKKS